MLKELIRNWNEFCKEENFVGIGSTRKVYRVSDYAIKVHLHPIGKLQSIRELEVYNEMGKRNLKHLFAETFYVGESISIQKYCSPLELRDNQSYDISVEEDVHLIPNRYEEVLSILDKDFDCFDLKDSNNYGLSNEGKLVFIDYGMTKNLYETEWVPLAESGRLPQIYFDFCNVCGLEKELRIYGKNDKDRRCYSCGKQ
jgi:hypothetical protein